MHPSWHCPAVPQLQAARASTLATNPKPPKPLPRSYYLLSRGVKLYYSTLMGLKGDLAEQQVGWPGGRRSTEWAGLGRPPARLASLLPACLPGHLPTAITRTVPVPLPLQQPHIFVSVPLMLDVLHSKVPH